MKMSKQNEFAQRSGVGGYEETLRLIARLPAPEGLAQRVQAGLEAVSHSAPRRARILSWPAALRPASGWMQGSMVRAVGAAAIALVVAGGGWGVVSRVQTAPPARGIALPHAAAPGGFAGAGAMRTPQTLNGPVVAPPARLAAPPAEQAAPPKAQTAAHRKRNAAAARAAQTPAPAAEK